MCFANELACKAVINWIVTFGFTQFVTFPTRETSTLDLVLCDKDQFICDVSPSPPGHCDHCVSDFSFLIRDSRVDSSKDINSIEQASVRYKWHAGDFDAINSYQCKKPNSLKHLVRTTVAGSHN